MFKYITNIVDINESPIDTIIYIGAGKCAELDGIQKLNAKKVLLIEANKGLFDKLVQRVKGNDSVDVLNSLVLPSENAKPVYWVANTPRFSGCLDLSAVFKNTLPNLRFEKTSHDSPVAINSVITKNIVNTTNNILIVDTNGFEGNLLSAVNNISAFFNYVFVSKYAAQLENSTSVVTTDTLKQQNFTRVFKQAAISGGFAEYEYWVSLNTERYSTLNEKYKQVVSLVETVNQDNKGLQQKLSDEQMARVEAEALANEVSKKCSQLSEQQKSTQLKIETLSEQLEDKNKEYSVLESRLAEQQEKLVECIKQKEEHEHWHNVHKQKAQTCSEELNKSKESKAVIQKQLSETQSQIDVLKAKLEENERELTRNQDLMKGAINQDALASIVEQITASHKHELAELKKKLDWRIDKGFNNSIKQVESFIGVQRFLESGTLSMNFHGWPISSDIALFLLGKINTNNYDLIIEFGSGTSTQLFAQAMKNISAVSASNDARLSHKMMKSDKFNAGSQELTEVVHDVPQRVLTFEHNKKYYDKTLSELKNAGLSDMVNLVHTPLIDTKVGSDDYLYYNCDKALANIASIFEGRIAKVLVLVDGPPGATGPLARLPAMSKLLNTLGNHQLDVVLDDYNRDEEKQTVEKWKAMLNARFIAFEEETVICEKGAFFCRINP